MNGREPRSKFCWLLAPTLARCQVKCHGHHRRDYSPTYGRGGGGQVGEHRETIFYNNEKHDNNSGTPVNLGVNKITVIRRSLSWRANSFHSPTNTTLKTSCFPHVSYYAGLLSTDERIRNK